MRKILILVVEDDPGLVDFLTACLKCDGYTVEVACGGRLGCEKARSLKPDLVILDLLLPDMHGFDVCQNLRKEESLNGVKILVSTAKAYPSDRRAALRLGADGFLVKPYTSDQLLAAVKGLLGSPGQ
ncbi:MAG: response regulator [Elusimicrobiota bacterium]